MQNKAFVFSVCTIFLGLVFAGCQCSIPIMLEPNEELGTKTNPLQCERIGEKYKEAFTLPSSMLKLHKTDNVYTRISANCLYLYIGVINGTMDKESTYYLFDLETKKLTLLAKDTNITESTIYQGRSFNFQLPSSYPNKMLLTHHYNTSITKQLPAQTRLLTNGALHPLQYSKDVDYKLIALDDRYAVLGYSLPSQKEPPKSGGITTNSYRHTTMLRLYDLQKEQVIHPPIKASHGFFSEDARYLFIYTAETTTSSLHRLAMVETATGIITNIAHNTPPNVDLQYVGIAPTFSPTSTFGAGLVYTTYDTPDDTNNSTLSLWVYDTETKQSISLRKGILRQSYRPTFSGIPNSNKVALTHLTKDGQITLEVIPVDSPSTPHILKKVTANLLAPDTTYSPKQFHSNDGKYLFYATPTNIEVMGKQLTTLWRYALNALEQQPVSMGEMLNPYVWSYNKHSVAYIAATKTGTSTNYALRIFDTQTDTHFDAAQTTLNGAFALSKWMFSHHPLISIGDRYFAGFREGNNLHRTLYMLDHQNKTKQALLKGIESFTSADGRLFVTVKRSEDMPPHINIQTLR